MNKETGEILDEIQPAFIKSGSLIIPPEERKRRKMFADYDRERVMKQYLNSDLGNFVIVNQTEQFNGVTPINVTRLIMLSTYLNYDDNKIMIKPKKQMCRSDLANVLKISEPTVTRFLQEVCPEYIIDTVSGLQFNPKHFKRGKINEKEYIQIMKIYSAPIRQLYYTTDFKNHKYLGYVYKMLSYVNIEYNLLCENIFEQNAELINLLTFKDFALKIGYDITHLNRLYEVYKNFEFVTLQGNKENLILFVSDLNSDDIAKKRVIVNPHIFYVGSNYQNVYALIPFFKSTKRKKKNKEDI